MGRRQCLWHLQIYRRTGKAERQVGMETRVGVACLGLDWNKKTEEANYRIGQVFLSSSETGSWVCSRLVSLPVTIPD